MPVYKFRDKYYNKIIKEAKNRDLKNFIDEMKVSKGYSSSRLIKYVYMVEGLIKSSGENDLKKITKNDIIKYLKDLQDGKPLHAKNKRSRNLKTVNGYKECLKRFYKWLLGKDEEYPELVKWIKFKDEKNNILPEELLKQEDIDKLLDACNNARDKAIISLLWETSCRIGELGALTVKSFIEEIDKARINFPVSKTKSRRILILESLPYVKAWIAVHPLRGEKDFKDKPMFVSIRRYYDEPLDYRTYCDILKSVAKRAGINKPINPHHFRHSRATLLCQYMTEQQLKNYLGWTPSSRMASRYIHLSGADMDDAVLKMHGVTTKEGDKLKFDKPLVCSRCEFVNEPKTEYCSRCSYPLTVESALKSKVQVGNDYVSPELLSKIVKQVKKELGK